MTVRPRQRGALKGARRVSKLLKRLPDDVAAEMRAAMTEAGPVIAAYARAAAPQRSGALQRGIQWRLAPKTLRLRIGLLGKAANARLFYARILEFGRKAKTVTVRRSIGPGKRAVYQLRVKAIAPGQYDFLAGRAYRFAAEQLRPKLSTIWQKALQRASGGGDE